MRPDQVKSALEAAAESAKGAASDIEAIREYVDGLERANKQHEITIGRLQEDTVSLLRSIKDKDREINELGAKLRAVRAKVAEEVVFRPQTPFVAPRSPYANCYEFVKWLYEFLEMTQKETLGTTGELDRLRSKLRSIVNHASGMEHSSDMLREALEKRNADISNLEVEIGKANGNLAFNRRLVFLQSRLLEFIKPLLPEETYSHYYDLAMRYGPHLPCDERD